MSSISVLGIGRIKYEGNRSPQPLPRHSGYIHVNATSASDGTIESEGRRLLPMSKTAW